MHEKESRTTANSLGTRKACARLVTRNLVPTVLASAKEKMANERPLPRRKSVYHRMQDWDFQTRFQNNLQLTLDEETAILEREGSEPVTLPVQKVDPQTYSIDWSPVDERWVRGELQFG